MKKTISAFLIFTNIAAALVSCAVYENTSSVTSTPGENEAVTTAAAVAREDTPDGLPENLDFGGETFNILCRDRDWFINEITVDELTGDILNDAVYNRNNKVMERLNVVIKTDKIGGIDTNAVYNKIKTTVLAGDDTYDIAMGSAYHTISAAGDGYLIDWYGIDYIDLDADWWSRYYIEKAQIGEKLYFITGDIALSVYNLMFFTFFNKNVMDEYGVEGLYETVMDGKWTVDYMGSLIKDAYVDVNGDGKRDMDDRYGFGTSDCINVDVYWSAFDLKLVERGSDGYLKMALNHEKMNSALGKILDLFYKNTGTMCLVAESSDGEIIKLIDKFKADEFMFTTLRLLETDRLRDMEADYGIIPVPKYDEAQEQYYSYVHDQYSTVCVPMTVKDTDIVGAVVEAMCAENYRRVLPVYFDIVLDNKYTRDPESAAMIDLGLGSFKVDTGWIYSKPLNNISAYLLRTLVANKSDGYAAEYASREQATLTLLEKLNESFRELETK